MLFFNGGMNVKSTATNMGFVRVWQDVVTSATVRYQLQFWA